MKFPDAPVTLFPQSRKESIFTASHKQGKNHEKLIGVIATPGPGSYRLPSDFGYYISKNYLENQNLAQLQAIKSQ